MSVKEGWDVTDRTAQRDLLRKTAVDLYDGLQLTLDEMFAWTRDAGDAEHMAEEVVTDWEERCRRSGEELPDWYGEELPDWYGEIDRELMVREIARRIKRDLP